jgi:hypothetical protein
MKKLITTTTLAALASFSVNSYSAQDKVSICHNYQTLSVARPSVQSHLNHGDFSFEDYPEGDCEKPSGVPETGPGTTTYVVMIRCDGPVVVSYEDSSDAGVDALPPESCPQLLGDLLNGALGLESVTGGSAGTNGDLNLYTDYLFLGNVEEAEEAE